MNAKIAKIKQINFTKNNNSLENNSNSEPISQDQFYNQKELTKFGFRKSENYSTNDQINNSDFERTDKYQTNNSNFENDFDDNFERTSNDSLPNNFGPSSPLVSKDNSQNYFGRQVKTPKNQTPQNELNNAISLVNNHASFGQDWENNFDNRMNKTEQGLKKISNKVVIVKDGNDRVFRKSMIFLLLSIVSFGFLTLAGINLFFWSSNLVISFGIIFLTLIIYTICTNIFFIILADKLYLWVFLGCHFLIIAFLHSIIGSLNFVTLGMALAIVILVFFGYSELEKTQLGSRLFMIGNITGESTRILLTLSTLVICLGVFNNIISKGTTNGKFSSGENYFSQAFLENDFIINNILIGSKNSAPNSVGQNVGRNIGLNTAFMGRTPNTLFVSEGSLKKQVDGEVQNATLGDFLANNYKPGQTILTPNELEDQQNKCAREKITNCDGEIDKLKRIKLEIWKSEGYRDLSFGLDSGLDSNKFRQVNRQFYRNLITSFGDSKEITNNSTNSQILPFIPNLSANLLVPSIFTFLLYILLSIIRPIVSLLVTFLTWIIWQILRKTGFVHIEIENVQAETVNI